MPGTGLAHQRTSCYREGPALPNFFFFPDRLTMTQSDPHNVLPILDSCNGRTGSIHSADLVCPCSPTSREPDIPTSKPCQGRKILPHLHSPCLIFSPWSKDITNTFGSDVQPLLYIHLPRAVQTLPWRRESRGSLTT